MITPTTNRINKQLQIVDQGISRVDKDISALNHQMSRGGYSVAGYIKAKVAAKKALQLQQDQLKGNLTLIDQLATKPIYPTNNPNQPTFPNRIVFLILGALLGLLLGSFIAWWKDKK